jgi:hypothetical protein
VVDKLTGLQGRTDTVCHLAEYIVSVLAAVPLVDDLEIINADPQQNHVGEVRIQTVKMFAKRAFAQQPADIVCSCLLADLIDAAHKKIGGTVGIIEKTSLAVYPDGTAVSADPPVFQIVCGLLAGDDPMHIFVKKLKVIWINITFSGVYGIPDHVGRKLKAFRGLFGDITGVVGNIVDKEVVVHAGSELFSDAAKDIKRTFTVVSYHTKILLEL